MNRSPKDPEGLISPGYQRHKKQYFWQILAPIGIGLLMVTAAIAMIILTATRGDPGMQISGWADFSLIWLILPILLTAVLFAVLLFGLVYLLARVLRILPVYTGLIQQYAGWVAEKVGRFSDMLVVPVIRIKSFFAGIGSIAGKKHDPFQK